jgi:hypothetical protein
MSAVLTVGFGNANAIRAAKAANAAYDRAIRLGYCQTSAQQFARQARREASAWEEPSQTALRIVLPKRGTFAGPTGGTAA